MGVPSKALTEDNREQLREGGIRSMFLILDLKEQTWQDSGKQEEGKMLRILQVLGITDQFDLI